MRAPRRAVTLAALALWLAEPGRGQEHCADGPSRLAVQLGWNKSPRFAAFHLPTLPRAILDQVGFPSYGDECLEVEILEATYTTPIVDRVREEQVDVGMTWGLSVILNALHGDLTSIAHYNTRSTRAVLSAEPEDDPQHYQGSEVYILPDPLSLDVQQMFAEANVSVNYRALSTHYEEPFRTGAGVQMTVYSEIAQILSTLDPSTGFLRQRSTLGILDPTDYGFNDFTDVIFVKSSRLPELWDRLVSWLRVVNRAFLYCRDYEAVCAALHGESEHNKFFMRGRNKVTFPAPRGLGMPSMEQWIAYDAYAKFAHNPLFRYPGGLGASIWNLSLLEEAWLDPWVNVSRAKDPYNPDWVELCAPYGTDEVHACNERTFEHTLCPSGSSPSGPNDGDCTPCPVGTYSFEPLSPAHARMLTCVECPTGYFQDRRGASSCNACPAGTYANVSAAAACQECQAGSYADEPGLSACRPCEPGTFAESNGTATCPPCEANTYATASGAVQCDRCPPLQATQRQLRVGDSYVWAQIEGAASNESCGCMEGTRLLATGECEVCSEGMVCSHGRGRMTIAPGYYASPEEPASIFQCHTDKHRCPGGEPGQCTTGRHGTTCAWCETGKHPLIDGTCEECQTLHLMPMVMVIVIIVPVLCCIYYAMDSVTRAKQVDSVLLFFACSQALTLTQQLGVLHQLSLMWPAPFQSVLKALLVLNFDIEFFNLGCLASPEAPYLYAYKVLCIAVLTFVMLIIHAGFVVVRYGGRFSQRIPSLIGSLGSICMAFFIPIVSSVAEPFECIDHPNGLDTVRSYPTVICWRPDMSDGEHVTMLIIASFALLVPMAFVVMCLLAVFLLPSKLQRGDTKFLSTWTFLFFRFRHGSHWYVLVFIARNVLVSLSPTLPDSAMQIIFLQVILLAYACVTIRVFPWRTLACNVLEISSTACVVLILLFAPFFVDDVNKNTLGFACLGIFACCMVVIILAFSYGVYYKYAPRRKPFKFFLCHHKDGAGSFCRLLKMVLQERMKHSKQKVFIDCDDLTDMEELFGYVRNQAETFVVLCSRGLLSRAWCMGELATAFLHNINTVLVVYNDFAWLDVTELRNCAEKIPNVQDLAAHGIHVNNVKDAVEWMMMQPKVTLSDGSVNNRVMARLASTLVLNKRGASRDMSLDSVDLSHDDQELLESYALILVDHDNMEAAATAYILEKLMRPLTYHCVELIPSVLPAAKPVGPRVKKTIVICSNGCFLQPTFMKQLMAAERKRAQVLPIISEDGFRFPSDELYRTLRQDSSHMSEQVGCSADSLVGLVASVFMEIAIVVAPASYSTTEEILKVRAQEMLTRLKSTLRPLNVSKGLAFQGQRGRLSRGGNGRHLGSPRAKQDLPPPSTSLQQTETGPAESSMGIEYSGDRATSEWRSEVGSIVDLDWYCEAMLSQTTSHDGAELQAI